MRPHSYPRAGHPEQFGAVSAWPLNVTMPDRGGVDAPWAEQEPSAITLAVILSQIMTITLPAPVPAEDHVRRPSG